MGMLIMCHHVTEDARIPVSNYFLHKMKRQLKNI